MSSTACPRSFRWLVLALLLALAGALATGAAWAGHRHDVAGLYDERCPVEALATAERPGTVVAGITAAPADTAGAPVAVAGEHGPALAPAADARLRAPPAR